VKSIPCPVCGADDRAAFEVMSVLGHRFRHTSFGADGSPVVIDSGPEDADEGNWHDAFCTRCDTRFPFDAADPSRRAFADAVLGWSWVAGGA
jgi:hypothetical protein